MRRQEEKTQNFGEEELDGLPKIEIIVVELLLL